MVDTFRSSYTEGPGHGCGLPRRTRVAREYTMRFGVADRYDYLEGDLRETDFGRERLDLVILGLIIHGEGREHGRKLIERAFDTLLRDRAPQAGRSGRNSSERPGADDQQERLDPPTLIPTGSLTSFR